MNNFNKNKIYIYLCKLLGIAMNEIKEEENEKQLIRNDSII